MSTAGTGNSTRTGDSTGATGTGGRPEPFGARLAKAMAARGPLCVGIDPHDELLRGWGLPVDVEGLARFADTVLDALAGRAAVLKPQSAFFERHGSAGIAVLERVVAQARAAGALVLLDAKRGDIGSTMRAYAQAYLDPAGPMGADAITASPYLGFGSLSPLLDVAAEHGAGVFVLALTSNPEGRTLQHALTSHGRSVAAEMAAAAGEANRGARPMGSVGLVVGATLGQAVREAGVDLVGANAPLLAPGIGAQGASPSDLLEVFGPARPRVLPSVSREVLAAGPGTAGLVSAFERTLAACDAALNG